MYIFNSNLVDSVYIYLPLDGKYNLLKWERSYGDGLTLDDNDSIHLACGPYGQTNW